MLAKDDTQGHQTDVAGRWCEFARLGGWASVKQFRATDPGYGRSRPESRPTAESPGDPTLPAPIFSTEATKVVQAAWSGPIPCWRWGPMRCPPCIAVTGQGVAKIPVAVPVQSLSAQGTYSQPSRLRDNELIARASGERSHNPGTDPRRFVATQARRGMVAWV